MLAGQAQAGGSQWQQRARCCLPAAHPDTRGGGGAGQEQGGQGQGQAGGAGLHCTAMEGGRGGASRLQYRRYRRRAHGALLEDGFRRGRAPHARHHTDAARRLGARKGSSQQLQQRRRRRRSEVAAGPPQETRASPAAFAASTVRGRPSRLAVCRSEPRGELTLDRVGRQVDSTHAPHKNTRGRQYRALLATRIPAPTASMMPSVSSAQHGPAHL